MGAVVLRSSTDAVHSPTTSYRENIILALLNNNLNKATELFDEALAAGINVEGYSRPQ